MFIFTLALAMLALTVPSTAQYHSPYARYLAPGTSDPSPAREGQLYANTTSHAPKYYNGSSWKTFAFTDALPAPGVTNSAPANAVPKSNGTNLVASQISDDGTDVIIDTGSNVIQLSTAGSVNIGDIGGAGNGTSISVDDSTQRIVLFSPGYTQVQGELRVTGAAILGGGTIGTRPACDATQRRKVWVSEGGAGAKDTVAVCAKDAADVYAWRTIY